MRAAATVVLAKRTPCAWKENTVLSIITFASATVALENDRSATKLPHLNSNATVHYHMMVQHGTVVCSTNRVLDQQQPRLSYLISNQ